MPLNLPTFRSIASVMIGAALFLSVGGHLAVLQGFAWTTMVHDFARQDSLGTALEKTLSGQHPCGLCKEIAKAGSDTHGKNDSTAQKAKFGEFIDQRPATSIIAFARPYSYPPSLTAYPRLVPFPPPSPVPIQEQA